jgi:FkbM family methyltransferase
MSFRSILRECTPPILVRAVRSVLKPPGDPIVRKTVRCVELIMRDSHNLPRYVAEHPLYDTALPAFVAFLIERTKQRVFFVDIGANVGDTAALVAAATGPDHVSFLCVEADDEFFSFLQENTKNLEVQACHVIAGANNRIDNAVIRSAGGSAAVVLGIGDPKQVIRVDDLIDGRPVDLIKIDTDGFEYEVLSGLSDTLTKQNPYLFVEFSPRHLQRYGQVAPSTVLSLLQSYGYISTIVYDNLGHPLGVFDLESDHLSRLTQYCIIKRTYIDILLSKGRIPLMEFYEHDLCRYPISALP